MWILVAVLVIGIGKVEAHQIGTYASMTDCFAARDVTLQGRPFPPKGSQIVCIAVDE